MKAFYYNICQSLFPEAIPIANLSLPILILFSFSCQTKNEPNVKSSEAEYVGDQKCMQCHQVQFNQWKTSDHAWAMATPTDATLLGDFEERHLTLDSVSYQFSMKDSIAQLVVTDIDGITTNYEIAFTFGRSQLQQYLVKFPSGRYQSLRATWDTDSGRWFHQYAGEEIDPRDWLHWTKGAQTWNTMCAECHSTNLNKNYFMEEDSFHTTYSSINVSCEACHGSGSKHIAWVQKKRSKDPYTTNAFDQQSRQLDNCAICHSRRVKLTQVARPGARFEDQYLVQTINSEYYHADGQIKEEDYVYGSFLQSKMYANGVKCTDCHNPHSLELKLQGNSLCLQCHDNNYDSEAHHFHPATGAGSNCIDCHMTGRYYMGNDFRRDHSFRVPRPDQSIDYSIPNACTGCHKNKSNQWAADKIVDWYGDNRPDHFSDVLLIAANSPTNNSKRQAVLDYINNWEYPAIARATAIEYLPINGKNDEISTLLKALSDSSALVRYHALQKIMVFSLEVRLPVALKHLGDSMRLVRIGAARLLIGKNINQLSPNDHSNLMRARAELKEMMDANADFPAGRLQYGDYYMQQQKTDKAIAEYTMALKMDSLLTPVYSNLATAYNLRGNNAASLTTLNKLLKIEPEYGRGYYLRALLKHEMDDDSGAIKDLEKSIHFEPSNFRTYYNLANLLLTTEQLKRAEQTMQSGLSLQPTSQEGLYLLALIYKAQGRNIEAEEIISALNKDKIN